MNLVEIATPAGALDVGRRRALVARLVTAFLGGPEESAAVPEATLRRARSMAHLGFRELEDWSTGHGPWSAQSTPPLWITVTVPESWRQEAGSQLISLIGRAVRAWDADQGWERPGHDLWVNVVGVHDGCLGLAGRPATSDDVLAYMTEEHRAHPDPSGPLPEGVVVDPMCGMQVRLGPRAITLDHGGTTHGFCARACRDAYARQHGLPVPA
ncbi:hypothetical protein [Nocardioides ferulae]|uniref:hypothetical protein n=1 Tax=Nocardioides ferulae TaxID=2340821 RepID=UPI000EB31D97|nr:hypothetical protein [Nocardioides ferulae]